MRIARTLLPEASLYDRKSFQIDGTLLGSRYPIVPAESADIVHVYGPAGYPAPNRPYVASAPPGRGFWWRKSRPPLVLVSPLDNLPEAVADLWFEVDRGRSRPRGIVGSFDRRRRGVTNMIEQTMSRIHRFRDDVEWIVFDNDPTPADLTRVDVWVDPATVEEDFDGCVAEALVAGNPVVASRIPINTRRLDKGMSGFLVPPRDPNELAHAILGALFKSESASRKIESARQTAGKFRPRHRLRALEKIYEAVIA